MRQLLDDSLGDGSLITGSEARIVDTSGSQLIYILYLAPGAPQMWKLLLHPEAETKWPKETTRFTFFCRKNLSTPILINNHYRLPLSQFLDNISVGPEGRSGGAQAHPRALCHTLGNPVPVPPTLGPGGQVGGVSG